MTRWMTAHDMPSIQALPGAMPASEFFSLVGSNEYVAVVYEDRNGLLGYVLYHMKKRSTEILSLVVHPKWRRRGIGSALLHQPGTRRSIVGRVDVKVKPGDLPAQAFLGANGFEMYEEAEGLQRYSWYAASPQLVYGGPN